ncbi:MAG: glycosyltransferase [Polyangiales bacterium]|nr:glycosyltransferase [Myxococcales bacterium]MCB9599821.1 glycosyltransferase [Sandaracinus sp.]
MGDYLMVVQAPAFVVNDETFAIEGAFGEHLRVMKRKLDGRFDRLLLAAPQLPESEYRRQSATLAHVSRSEGIELVPLHPVDCGKAAFWGHEARAAWSRLVEAVSTSDVVHAGLADDLWRPTMAFANAAGLLAGKKILFFVDIDFRNDTTMYRRSGMLPLRQYWMNRLVYDPIKLAQVHLAPRLFDLVFFKSERMVQEVGRGRANVKNFFDTAHAPEHVVSDAGLATRRARVEAGGPLEVVFFGRFVEYKGLDRSIDAVLAARRAGDDIRLTLIGQGDEREALERLVADRQAEAFVTIQEPLRYGPELFDALERYDVQLATPLVEDTPRAAFDAMARGLPIAAFGINYYRDLEELSGAVRTSKWPDVEDLGRVLVELHRDRSKLSSMSANAVAFARDNTQEQWLDRRVRWTLELLEARG